MKLSRRVATPLATAVVAGFFSPAFGQGYAPMSDSAIKEYLTELVDSQKRASGIVVGVIDTNGVRVFGHGKTVAAGKEVDGNTVFEIGSATKVFTSLVLADMVTRGEVKLFDPISKFLPASVKSPQRNGREITLIDLATHSSGLPRLPSNLLPRNLANPYADYTVKQMYDFLSGYELPRDIGSQYEYSNFGVGLLGHLLALKAGTNYESLVRQRICKPLGMTDTVIKLTPELRSRLAIGHNDAGKPVANWDLPTLAGAGALRSTVNDMVKFVSASMGRTKTELAAAMELQQKPVREAGSPQMQIGLGWHISTRSGIPFLWHNGGTGGYHSFIGFIKERGRGVVVLSNSSESIDDVGAVLAGIAKTPDASAAKK